MGVSNAVNGDPAFVDPSGYDYRLRAGSPAIDQGDAAGVSSDFDGEARPALAPDLGSDEAPQLRIHKAGPAQANIGALITYTLTVTNTGIPAISLVISDVIPTHATFIAASRGGANMGGGVSWNTPTLAAGAALTATFTVTAAQTITNSDYAVASSAFRAAGSQTVVTTILPPGLRIAKSGPTTANPGQTIVYTFTFTNTGSAVDRIIISDTLPTGANFVGPTGPNEWSVNGNVASLTLDPQKSFSYGGGLQKTLTITATRTLTNADYEIAAYKKNPGNVYTQLTTASGNVTVVTTIAPALAIKKSGPATASPNQAIVYTLRVTNTGGLANNVVVTDTYDAHATFVSASHGGVHNAAQHTLTWPAFNLPHSVSVTRVFTVTATQTVTNSHYRAQATGGYAATGSTAVNTVIAPNLAIRKTAPYSVTASAEITFTLTVTNTGGLASGVVITDHVPIHATFIRAQGSITPDASQVVRWNLPTSLPYNGVVSRTFTVSATQTITNVRYGVRATGVPAYTPMLPVVVRVQ